MATYDIKLKKVKDEIINKCKELIESEFNGMSSLYFHTWIQMDGCCEIPQLYIDQFNNEFSEYIDDNCSGFIQSYGSHLGYHIDALITIQPNITFNKLFQYIKTFITNQFDDFNNCCGEISESYHNRNPEISDTSAPIIQNPSSEDNPN